APEGPRQLGAGPALRRSHAIQQIGLSRPYRGVRYQALALAPAHGPAAVAVEFHTAERAALVEIADRIRLELGLLGHGVFAEVFAAAGRPIAEFVSAVVVPPGALIVGGAVEDLEMDIGVIEPDPAELHEVFRLQP